MRISWSERAGAIGLHCARWRQPNTGLKRGTDPTSDYELSFAIQPALWSYKQLARLSQFVSKRGKPKRGKTRTCIGHILAELPLQSDTNHTKWQSQIALAFFIPKETAATSGNLTLPKHINSKTSSDRQIWRLDGPNWSVDRLEIPGAFGAPMFFLKLFLLPSKQIQFRFQTTNPPKPVN